MGGRRRRRPRRWRARLPRGPRSIRGCPRRTPRGRRDEARGGITAGGRLPRRSRPRARRRAIEAVGEGGEVSAGDEGGWRGTFDGRGRARASSSDERSDIGVRVGRAPSQTHRSIASRAYPPRAPRGGTLRIASRPPGSPWRPRALGVVARRAPKSDSFKPSLLFRVGSSRSSPTREATRVAEGTASIAQSAAPSTMSRE